MKTLAFIIIGLITVLMATFFYTIERIEQKLELIEQPYLEIYTRENIYYVQGLNVTDESLGIDIDFRTAEDLKTFISRQTAADAKKEFEDDKQAIANQTAI